MSDKREPLEAIGYLEEALGRLETNESVVYFLVYDTKDNARAAVKHIYDMALILKQNGFNARILVENKDYTGVKGWLGDEYDELPLTSIKDDKPEIHPDDILVIPEQYSNILPEISGVKCTKIMLLQQKDYMFETLPIGSRWSQYGVDRSITTTETAKKYILEHFSEALAYIIPPYIGDHFTPTEKPTKPLIAISCRDRSVQRRIISEFYLKFPHLRWITFRDMVQMSYEEFALELKECLASVWIDDESTFGTFPLESMKCGVPVIGKIPNTEPDWLDDNGLWTYDINKVVDLIGAYVMSWLEGKELELEVKSKMRQAPEPFTKENITLNTLSVFNTLHSQQIEAIKRNLEKLKSSTE